MSRQCIHWSTREREKVHKQKVLRKLDKIAGLQDLLDTHENLPDPDHKYVLQLRAKLRCAQNQYNAMKPI